MTPSWDAVDEPHATFPWPPAEGESIIAAIARTWQGAALEPRGFFGSMPVEGSMGAALLFYVPIAIVQSGAALFWGLVLSSGDVEGEGAVAAISPLLQFLFSPLLALLGLVMAAGVVHLLLKLFGGANRDFAFTMRVFCYAYAPQLLSVIPWAGPFVGFVWMVVVAIIGLAAGHRTGTGRAAAAVLIPLTFLLAMLAVAALILAATSLLPPL